MVQDAKVLSFNKNKQFGDQNCKQNPYIIMYHILWIKYICRSIGDILPKKVLFWNQFGAETYILLVLFFIHILRSMAPTKM